MDKDLIRILTLLATVLFIVMTRKSGGKKKLPAPGPSGRGPLDGPSLRLPREMKEALDDGTTALEELLERRPPVQRKPVPVPVAPPERLRGVEARRALPPRSPASKIPPRPSLSVPERTHIPSIASLRSDRQAVRQAIVLHALLGPPKIEQEVPDGRNVSWLPSSGV